MRWLPLHKDTESSCKALSMNDDLSTALVELARLASSFRNLLAGCPGRRCLVCVRFGYFLSLTCGSQLRPHCASLSMYHA